MSGLRVLLLQQSGGGGFWTVLMSVNPKMCDLDPLSPLPCLPLVLVLSRSCVSCLVLCSSFFFFFCRACCECDFASVFFYLLVDNAETIFHCSVFFSVFRTLFFFFFFFSWEILVCGFRLPQWSLFLLSLLQHWERSANVREREKNGPHECWEDWVICRGWEWWWTEVECCVPSEGCSFVLRRISVPAGW